MTSSIEHIKAGNLLIAILVPGSYSPSATEFLTPSELNMQLGFIKYPEGSSITPHVHTPIERNTIGTNEVLIVQSGKIELSLYDEAHVLIAQRILNQGDFVLLIGGGHGIQILEDAVLLEVKQGPYSGLEDKSRF